MSVLAKLQIKRSTALTVAAVIAVGLLSYWLTTRDWLIDSFWWQKSEGALIDQRYLRRGERSADTNIVLVGVETTSMTLDNLRPEDIQTSPILQHMREPLPWNRKVFAATLEKLAEAGAKVVVFDFVFANSKEGDDEFEKALEKYRDKVVLASMIDMNEYRYIPPNARLWPPGTNQAGLVNVWADSDGTVRRGRYRTSLVREDADRLAKFASAETDDLIHMTALAVKKFAGNVDTPPYDHDNFIDFPGGWKYHSIPIERLFVKADWDTPTFNGGLIFSNKIVIVGPLAEIYKDVHRTPFGVMAGPELQAQMMATLLNHSSLEEPSPRYNTLLTIGLISAALAICLLASHAVIKASLLLGTAIGFAVVCQFTFSHGNLVIPMMSPLFGLITTGSSGMVLQFFVEQMERRRMRHILERHVSKNVANKVLADHRSFEELLRGKKQSVTILFSDIRGFTSMSEGSDPENLVRQLNEYFEEMVGVVQDEKGKGTLQKFIGDAIMAAWGDVYSAGVAEDARLAIKTAVRMRAGLKKLNATWSAAPNRVPLDIGIGVNHGDAVVGYTGSPERMEFTVLGDAINLAARLESATKQFHVDILVGENAEALTRPYFIFRKVGLLTVKGRTRAVEAFTVLGEKEEPVPPWLERYHDAVNLFRAREFRKAGELFKTVSAEIEGPDFLCELHSEWCARYQQEPPPADWAGNFVLTEK